MITLIACGHSVGVVHSVDHPELVSGTPSLDNTHSFDTTSAVLDNAPVLEYLNNSTTNPLVVNANDTLNSDKRIFASDNGVTMKKLADPSYFKSQCENVFGRMLNLVPGDVTLSEPLEPADIRPYITSYSLNADGTVSIDGTIRVRVTPVTDRDQNNLTVSLIPASRNGSKVAEIAAPHATYLGGTSTGFNDEVLVWFEFYQSMNASEAFSSFDIRVNDVTYDNGGTGGYPVNLDVLYQQKQSCLVKGADNDHWELNVTAAVSKSILESGATPQIRLVHRVAIQGFQIPRLEQEAFPMTRSSKEMADHVYYTTTVIISPADLMTTFDIEVGDSKVQYISTGALLSTLCAPL